VKTFLLIATCLFVAVSACAESPQQWAGAGASFNQYAAPQTNGIMAYARRITGDEHPTYSFSAVNLLSVERQPFRLLTTTETGIAQHVTKFGVFDVYGLGMVGLAAAGNADGTSSGAVFSGGGLALAGIGRGWTVGPMVRIIKPTISERQWSIGMIVGWGR
jgi:hypothetical protein